MSQKSIDTKPIPLGPEMKLKKMGLFRLYWEIYIEHKQTKELQATQAALENNFTAFHAGYRCREF